MKLTSRGKILAPRSQRAGRNHAAAAMALGVAGHLSFPTVVLPTLWPMRINFPDLWKDMDISASVLRDTKLNSWLSKLPTNTTVWVKSDSDAGSASSCSVSSSNSSGSSPERRILMISPECSNLKPLVAKRYFISIPSNSSDWSLICMDGQPLQRVRQAADGNLVVEDASPEEVAAFDAILATPQYKWLQDPPKALLPHFVPAQVTPEVAQQPQVERFPIPEVSGSTELDLDRTRP